MTQFRPVQWISLISVTYVNGTVMLPYVPRRLDLILFMSTLGHQLSTISHFLSPYRNRRSDEYGGSLENRARLLREVLADTKDAVGDTCGVALRFAVDELLGNMGFTSAGEGP